MLEQEASEARTMTAATAREEMRRFIGFILRSNFPQESTNCAKTHDFLFRCGKLWMVCSALCHENDVGRLYFWES